MQPGDDWVAVIIEDDPDVRDLIDIVLTQSGFRTVVTENGPDGIEAVREHQPLITTLDVNMPGMDGFAVARRLREFSNGYLIMITALGDEIDVVQGFEAGADDYLVKPFRPRELRARADSMLRRPRTRVEAPSGWAAPGPARQPRGESPAAATAAAPAAAPAAAQHHRPVPPDRGDAGGHRRDGRRVRFNGLALDEEARVVTVDGAAVDLSRTELDLLSSLLSTGRRVRSKADLVLTIRGQQHVTSYFVDDADKRSVEMHLASLRRKLGDDGAVPRFIETVRGVGYRLAAGA